MIVDPFGLGALGDSTRSTWRSSPTRLAEDIATEHDLAAIGYRDRLLIELAANAADAATAAGIAGRVSIWLDDAALVVANTGAPLSAQGVTSLLAVRVSPKQPGASNEVIGRFGVGFSAVATVADRVEIRSTTGSLVFDRQRCAQEVDAADAPLLRIAWPIETPPPAGYDTAVVLHLRADVDAAALLADMARNVADLLLELPALEQFSVGETTTTRRVTAVAEGIDEVILDAGQGNTRRFVVSTATSTGTRWLVETVDGVPRPYERDYLRAPTETDIELSLPARVIAAVAVTPDRRTLYPGTDIVGAAAGYVELVRAIEPAHRAALVPRAGLARNDVDATLRDAVTQRLHEHRWLPRAHVVDGEDLDVSGNAALVFPDASPELARLVGQVLADLIDADLSSTRTVSRLRSVDVTPISLARLADELASVQQPPQWWAQLYDALSPYVSGATDAQELGALPIPRADGRMNFGARGLYLPAPGVPAVGWLPTVADAAVHPLLERLGAVDVSVSQMLAAHALRAALEALDDAVDDIDFDDAADALAADVLALIAADVDADVPDWLAGLPIRDADGELARADELLLPDSPLARVVVDESPFALVDDELVTEYGVDALRRLGVGWGFSLVHDELPTGPDHDLADESQWWDTLSTPPAQLSAVRDLDLVAPDRWPEALTLLADDPAIVATLADPDSYLSWWLRSFAEVGGRSLAQWRSPADVDLDEVLDPLEHPRAEVFAMALGQIPIRSTLTARAILAGLADRRRTVSPGQAVGAYAAVVQALSDGVVDIEDLGGGDFTDGDDGVGVRTLDGGVAGESALVVDHPWLLQVINPADAVLAGIPVRADAADILADALDLRLASEALSANVIDPGDASTWASSVTALSFTAERGDQVPHGEVRLHDHLTVRVEDDRGTRDVSVAWWVDDRDVTHLRR